jgi:large subunit ribosomal protein L10
VAGKNREIKEAKVQDIKTKLGKAQSLIFAKYQGLTVEEDTELRKKLREEGVEYKVYKNNLTSLAVKELGINDIDSFLTGPTSVAFSYSDATAPARILNNYSKEHKNLELKGGYVQGVVYDAAKITMLATIPSREVLISKLLGSLQSPLSKFAYVIDAIAKSKEA